MKTLEIYFRDLTPEAQEAALALLGIGSPQDANWDSFPLFTLEADSRLEEGSDDV